MNGPIAQIIALACHANAYLSGNLRGGRFFPANSACQFCDRIEFVEIQNSNLGNGEIAVANSPDDWFAYLQMKGVQTMHVARTDTENPVNSDRMSAAFVGGGGNWMLAAEDSSRQAEIWMARWQVWNQNAPEQRIWRVTYGRVATRQSAFSQRSPSLADEIDNLRSALQRIHGFAKHHELDGFAKCFERALESIKSCQPLHGYHKDLFVPGTLPVDAAAALDAAQSAWVFGGMGSWNDMGFEGDEQVEYDTVSEALFRSLNNTICASANESARHEPRSGGSQ